MKLSEKRGDFTPHDDGSFRAVCVDVTPLQKQQSKFGEQEIFRLVFETDAPARGDGSLQCVWSRGFTPSLNEKANLRKFLRQWFGRDLSPMELVEFDTETLIGKPASVVVVHETAENGNVYANIAACTPYKGDKPLAASGKFTRKKDREAKGEGAAFRGAAEPTGGTQEGESVDNTQAGADWTKVKVHVGKHSGVELRDLDVEAIGKLIENWLPIFKGTAKPTADDTRLAAALELAEKEVMSADQPF